DDQPLVAITQAGRPDVQTPPVGAVEAPEAQLRLGMHQGAAAGAQPAHLGISFGQRGRVVGAPGERCFLLSLQTVQLGLEDRVGVVDVVLLCRDLVADGQRPAPFLRAKARRRRSGSSVGGSRTLLRGRASRKGHVLWPGSSAAAQDYPLASCAHVLRYVHYVRTWRQRIRVRDPCTETLEPSPSAPGDLFQDLQ